MLEKLPEFVGNHPILSIAFVGIVAALVYTEFSRLTRKWKEISTAEATRLINRENAVVLDVSSLKDYQQGHIVNAIHIPASQASAEHGALKKVEGKPIIVVCPSGVYSSQACKKLLQTGLQQPLYALRGGMTSWRNDQLPVVK